MLLWQRVTDCSCHQSTPGTSPPEVNICLNQNLLTALFESWCSYVLDKFQNILKKEANNTTTFHAKKKVERKEEEGEKGKENKQVHGEYEDDTINNETTNSNNNEKVRTL